MGLLDFLFGKKEETENKPTQVSSRPISSPVSDAASNVASPRIEQCFDPVTFPISQVRVKKLGEIDLAPYDAFWYSSVPDAMLLPLFANTDKIKRFLPGMDFSSETAAKETLKGYMLRTEMGLGVTYVIRSQNIPMGMIFVNTPNYNQKAMNLYIWTVDFFMFEANEHQGIMFNCLAQVLAIMQQNFRVPKVYAIVNAANSDCINLLYNPRNPLFTEEDNFGFKDKDHPGSAPRVFSIDLRKINFRHA